MRSREFFEFGQQLGGALRQFGIFGDQEDSPTGGQNTQRSPSTGMRERPVATPPTSRATSVGYDREAVDAVLQQYIEAGYDPEFAAGLAANFVVESNLNPSAVNEGEGAYGVAQWRNDRRRNLEEFAESEGMQMNNLDTQIAFSMIEFKGAERMAWDMIQGANPNSPAEYAALIDQHYKRSSGEARERRANLASQIYSDFFGAPAERAYNSAPEDELTDKDYDPTEFMFDEPAPTPEFESVAVTGALDGVDPRLVEMTQQAWDMVVPGGRIEVTTGVSDHSPTNHAPGHAIDYRVYDAEGNLIPTSDERHFQAGMLFRAMGGHGVGYGPGYMGGQHAHWDISANGPRAWGDDDGTDSDRLGAAQRAADFARADGMSVEELAAELGLVEGKGPDTTQFTTFDGTYDVTASAQSPGGGPPSAGPRGDGIQADYTRPTMPQTGEWDGEFSPFSRYDGESDDEYRDRRRSMWLAAASGFQMLSRGTTADFNTPQQMRMGERQRRFDRRFQISEQERSQLNFERQERRADRAQALAERRFEMESQAVALQSESEAERREAIISIAEDAGMKTAMQLAEAGYTDEAVGLLTEGQDATTEVLSEEAATAAIDRAVELNRPELAAIIESRAENPEAATEAMETLMGINNPESDAVGFAIGEATRRAAQDRAELIDRPDLAAAINDENPEVAQDALKQIFRAEVPEGASGPEFSQGQQALYDSLSGMIPAGIGEVERERLESQARSVVQSGGDATTIRGFYDAIAEQSATESMADTAFRSLVETDNEYFAEVRAGNRAVTGAAQRGREIAANPEFDSGSLRNTYISPIARLARDLPGGEAFNERFLDTDNVDLAGYTLLTSLRNGQIGNLARGINGQLSNLEGDRILSQLASGEMGRVEIMALSQVIESASAATQAADMARMQYLADIERGDREFDPVEYEEVQQEAYESIDAFQRLTPVIDEDGNIERTGNEQRILMAADIIEDYGATDFSQLPINVRSQVVSVYGENGSFELVPLFAEMFPEEFPEYVAGGNR